MTLPGATDCHMHIYGPLARYPVRHGAPPPALLAQDLAAWQRVRARMGITRTVVVQPSAYGTDNACTMDAVAALGDDARAVVGVTTATPPEELARLHALGARGARAFMLDGALVPWEGLAALARHVAALGWHIQLQFDGGEMEARAPLIAALEAPVVIDHLGRFHTPVTPDAAPMRALLRLLENGRTWVKASSPYGVSRAGPPDYADTAAIARAVIAAAPERVVWGSNWPHPNAPDPRPDEAELLLLLKDWAPDAATLRAILVDNPARLYGF